jgi:heat shock protein HtpX
MTGFLILVILIGWGLSWYYDDRSILYIAVIFALLTNVWSYWFSDRVVLSMTGAKPADKHTYYDLYTVTENLAITAGLPLPKVYVIEDPAPNAFATGRDEKHAVVCATTGLLAMLDRTELEGVIAHELSHVKNRDMLVMTIAVVLAGCIAIVADMFLRTSQFGGGRREDRGNSGALFAVLAIVAAILAPIAAQLIQLAVSRQREYLADASGALLTRYPEGLANALRKIGSYTRPMMKTNHATAHLFISNPYGARAQDFFNRLFSTHPPIDDRIRRLVGEKG